MFALIALCALISLSLIGVALWWHYSRDSVPASDLSHEKALYAQAVADSQRRLGRGDIDADEAREEQHEAARGLLKAADATPVSTLMPLHAYAVMAGAVTVALGLYLVIGFPDYGDQPFAKRLDEWRAAAAVDPRFVPPEALSAVLKAEEKDQAGNEQYWIWRGEIDFEAGQYYAANRAYLNAYNLNKDGFAHWYQWGQAMTAQSGRVTRDAEIAFRRALARDPEDARVNYYLARAAFEQGDYDRALTELNVVKSAMPAGSAAVDAVNDEIAGVERARANAASQPDPKAMVASLEARLEAEPENPQGWARLLRAYTVLGDTEGYSDALLRIQRLYASRPGTLQEIMVASQAPVGAEDVSGQTQ